ncbi:MAG: hypothetical protein KC800_01445 [Candidatus Eremiobacteraeota bacterium]|nr:hypothetical protein [Candidatus Eremiobacteraeota bacterium]
MSAGFGIGFTRQFCPSVGLAERVAMVEELMRHSGLARLRDFVYPDDATERLPPGSREAYRIMEFTLQNGEFRRNWLEQTETDRIQTLIGPHWSDSGSYEDCYLIYDEETSLILPGQGGKALWSHPSLEMEGSGSLVYARNQRAVHQLEERIENPELELGSSRLAVLRRAEQMLELCQAEHLAFYLAWG